MGLIYVNPEGPNGKPDPVASGRDIRETFARMAMNDEETVALIAGGHTFGKAHGAGDPKLSGRSRKARHRGAGPGLEEQLRQRQGRAHHHQRHRRRLEAEPHDRWDNGYFDMLFGYEWELVKSPAGAQQWQAKDVQARAPDSRCARSRRRSTRR
jgi:catalase-peroxidase